MGLADQGRRRASEPGSLPRLVVLAALALALSALRRPAESRRPRLSRSAAATVPKTERPAGARPGAAKEHADPRTAAREPGRGREADEPSEVPPRGWRDIALRIFKEFSDDRILANAGSVTYFALLALFPAITSLVSLYGLAADPHTINQHMSLLAGIVPEGGVAIITEQLQRLIDKGPQALGFGFISGLAIALWSANGGIKSLFDILNIVYDEKEKRSFLKLNALTLCFTLGAILFLLGSLAIVVVVPIVFAYFGVASETAKTAVLLLRWPALLLVVMFGLTVIYRFGPSRDKPKWRWVSWGSAIAAGLWVVVSLLFSWYAQNFGKFDETYGSLGAAIGFMTWLWMTNIVILLGAEINAELEHQTAEDTTEGPAEPLGTRGATMADTIGKAQR
jgi:membrane protein